MGRTSAIGLLVVLTAQITLAAEPPADADRYWANWRGPTGNGVAPHGDPPAEWSESKNVRWKVPIPGAGNASPIVWGDRVYLLTAVQTDKQVKQAEAAPAEEDGADRRGRRRGRRQPPAPSHEYNFDVLALDRASGRTIWQKTVCSQVPHEAGHPDATQASGSPITDGEHIYAYFGSRGLYCLDMSGNVVWGKDLGDMQTRNGFGEGSSPALHGDTIVVCWDHEGASFIVALDKKTGKELWRRDRDESTNWATPLVVDTPKGAQVVATATKRVVAYDLKTGQTIWECGGMTQNCIPSPVWDDQRVYAISGFRGSGLVAVKYREATGDVTDTQSVAWSYAEGGTPYVPSPVLYGERMYFLDNNRAMLTCFNAPNGRKLYDKKRLEGLEGVYASLVGAAERVYVVGRNGVTAVVADAPEFRMLASNTLDDEFDASPAIADGELYLRGRKHLYCIAKE